MVLADRDDVDAGLVGEDSFGNDPPERTSLGQRVLDRVFGWFHRTAPSNVATPSAIDAVHIMA